MDNDINCINYKNVGQKFDYVEEETFSFLKITLFKKAFT